MEHTKQLTETEAAVNYISLRMNEGDTSYWPGTEYALAAKRAAGEERTI